MFRIHIRYKQTSIQILSDPGSETHITYNILTFNILLPVIIYIFFYNCGCFDQLPCISTDPMKITVRKIPRSKRRLEPMTYGEGFMTSFWNMILTLNTRPHNRHPIVADPSHFSFVCHRNPCPSFPSMTDSFLSGFG